MRKLLVIVFVTLYLQTVVSKELETHLKIFPGKKLYALHHYANNLYYLQFNRSSDSSKMIIEAERFNDIFNNVNHMYNCTYQIEKPPNESHFFWNVRSDLLDEDKIVIYTKINFPANEYEMIILDLSTCTLIRPNIRLFTKHVLFTDSSFNIYFENNTLCGDKICRMKLDKNYNIIDGPTPWHHTINHIWFHMITISPKAYESEEKLLMFDNGNKRTSLVTKGEIKELLDIDKVDPAVLNFIEPSITNDIIGLAYSTENPSNNETMINVYQFYLNGTLTLRVKLNFTGLSDFLTIQNTKNGGFLLVTSKYIDSKYTVLITKYDAHGKIASKTLNIEEFDAKRKIYLYENQNKLNCIIQMQEVKLQTCKTKKCVQIIEKCFRNEDLDTF